MRSADTYNMKRFTFILLIALGVAVFSAAQIPGFEPFRQEGIASWYGRDFDGRPTASGEIFDSSLFTAAHPTLPFGTILTITNMQNNLQVTVRVNDRGPFVAARIIDLSMAAAEVLDMLTVGVAPVIVQQAVDTTLGPVHTTPPAAPPVIAPAPVVVPVAPPAIAPAPVVAPTAPPAIAPAPIVVTPAPVAIVPQEPAPPPQLPPAPPPAAPVFFPAPPAEIWGRVPAPDSPNLYRIQVGSYSVPRNAVEAFERLRGAGLNPAYERHEDLYRVVLPGLPAGDIRAIAQILGNLGFREVLIRQETGH